MVVGRASEHVIGCASSFYRAMLRPNSSAAISLPNFDFREGLEVTDDVSIVEYLKRPVRITEGAYTNIKVSLFRKCINVFLVRKSPSSLNKVDLSHAVARMS